MDSNRAEIIALATMGTLFVGGILGFGYVFGEEVYQNFQSFNESVHRSEDLAHLASSLETATIQVTVPTLIAYLVGVGTYKALTYGNKKS